MRTLSRRGLFGAACLACGGAHLGLSATPVQAQQRDRDWNPPGPAGGPGTNWENRPGPSGGPGASPDRRGVYR